MQHEEMSSHTAEAGIQEIQCCIISKLDNKKRLSKYLSLVINACPMFN